ncbi:hypothetical protein L1049_018431 [Liquidambar formosana]|uniref:Uncharacterized protein n=1 Tax=Liquidambar formosana TaxID=63359 RepID=A0AAP0RA32_LIQFO
MEQFKGKPRLPKFAVPKRYDIRLKPDLIACKFAGSVDVDVDIVDDTTFIVLNAADLSVAPGSVHFKTRNSSQEFDPTKVEMVEEDEILVLEFAETLPMGMGVLSIGFEGTLNDKMKGFYKSTYELKGEKRNMAVTQFEPADARRCFPCWDEPACKVATVVAHELAHQWFGNLVTMEWWTHLWLNEGFATWVSYLATDSLFPEWKIWTQFLDESAEGLRLDGLSESHPIEVEINHAREIDEIFDAISYRKGASVIRMLQSYIGAECFQEGRETAWNWLKDNWDHISKTWGSGFLITRFVSAIVSPVATVVAHELAHQWFGNLVTMEWWTHLWLNEGFATWVSYLAADSLFPEWKIWTQFLVESTEGLRLDGLAESHPIEVEINHAREIDEIFDAISYRKGASVIRMLQSYLGAECFQDNWDHISKTWGSGTYELNGEKRNMAVTNFEPVDARRCFPCWDEPACKVLQNLFSHLFFSFYFLGASRSGFLLVLFCR